MKIATYLMGAMLAAALGAAALFYISTFQPMFAEYKQMQANKPELEKAKTELKKYKEKETRETAWISPLVEELNKDLAEEIRMGKAEVTAAGAEIVINISEELLYTPGSVTFGKDSRPFLQRLATLLGNKDLKGKEIIIGNTTDSVPSQGKGRKKIIPRDARSLASERSLALTKFLEQNKVDQNSLVAASYASKLPDTGFKIKDHKTVIMIQDTTAPTAPTVAQKQGGPGQKPVPAAAAKPAEKTQTATPPAAGAQQTPPKTIPLRPSQPKGQ